MELTHANSMTTSVRLFPRLAEKPAADSMPNRRGSKSKRRPAAAATASSTASTQAEVRLHLLKMILDNERARRQGPHAS
jgi:hypothetical protein